MQRLISLPNDTVRPLPQFFGHSVTLVDNEVLVEDFEIVPTLQFRHIVVGLSGL